MLKSFARGRTGNLLFQYTFARLLGEELGLAADLIPVQGFEELPRQLHGIGYTDFEHAKPASDDYTDKSISDIAAELVGCPVMCYGFYERASLYTPWKHRIQRWFSLTPYSPNSRLAIHIRGHEAYREGYRCPPYEYFERAIEEERDGLEPIIYTDDPDNIVCLKLARNFHIPVQCSSPMQDFHNIRTSCKIILGNSTFSWWAAFLAAHNNVVQAEPITGWRSRDMPQKCLIVPEWKQLTY